MANQKRLSDSALISALQKHADRRKAVELSLVELLAEFVKRDLHINLGISTVYEYATTVLGFAPSIASRRLRAAQVVAARPEALALLREGLVSISSLSILLPVIETPGMLEFSTGRSCRDVQARVTELTGRSRRKNAGCSTEKESAPAFSPRLLNKVAAASRVLSTPPDESRPRALVDSLEAGLDALLALASSLVARVRSAFANRSKERGRGSESSELSRHKQVASLVRAWLLRWVDALFEPPPTPPLHAPVQGSKARKRPKRGNGSKAGRRAASKRAKRR